MIQPHSPLPAKLPQSQELLDYVLTDETSFYHRFEQDLLESK
jgi:hypothetical protein